MKTTALCLLVTATLPSCGERPAPETAAAVRAVIDAAPEHWEDVATACLECGQAAATPLAAELRQRPSASGAQLAVALLGRLGDSTVTPTLELLITQGHAVAAEACLALGALGSLDCVELLRGVIADHSREITVRTAAACALLDLGEVGASLPFLRCILLAGTPAGQALQTQAGVADKARWAHERLLVITAIRRHCDGEDFGLDPDNSWPQLEHGAAAFELFVNDRRAGHGETIK